MNTLKTVVGGGSKKDEAGQEPVSGAQGQGTVGQPYDAGNQHEDPNLAGKAAQHTNPNETPALDKSGQEPVSGQQGKGIVSEPFDAGNKEELAGKAPADGKSSDRPAEPTTTGANGDAKPSSKLYKSPTIGSSRWFANPFAKDKESTDEKAVQDVDPNTSTTAEAKDSGTEPTTLPPNHLGADVPPGQDSIVVDSKATVIDSAFATSGNPPNHLGEDVPPGATNGEKIDKGKGKAKATDTAEPSPGYTESSTTSYGSTRRESGSTDLTANTRNTFSSLATSVAGSIAGSSRSPSGNVHVAYSQGKPIMAGGVPLGLPAMKERERRFSSMVPNAYREDEETPKNTTTSTTNTASVQWKTAPPASKDTETAQTSPQESRSMTKHTSASVAQDANANDGKPRRRSSVMMRAKTLGRKFRHSIAH